MASSEGEELTVELTSNPGVNSRIAAGLNAAASASDGPLGVAAARLLAGLGRLV